MIEEIPPPEHRPLVRRYLSTGQVYRYVPKPTDLKPHIDVTASSTMYLTYRDETQTFASIGVWQENDATLTDRGEPERVRALRVSDGTLQVLGVQPMHGRWFTEQEHGPEAEGPAPVILSHAFWQRRFGGDEAALGRGVSIDSEPSRVVGIMPPGFRFLDMTPQPDVVLAVRFDPGRQVHGAKH